MASNPPSLVWTRVFGSTKTDYVQALVASSDGFIYAAGYASGEFDGQSFAGTTDAFLTKYSATGIRIWTKEFGTSNNDQAFALTQGLDGSLYVAGLTNGNLNSQINSVTANTFITKFSDAGQQLWTRLISNTSVNSGKAIATGMDGSVYVAGLTYGSIDSQPYKGGTDAFLTKFNADGTKSWTRLLGTSQDDQANGISVGLDGSIFLTGFSTGNIDGQVAKNGTDVFLVKFNSQGDKVWTVLLGTNNSDSGQSVVAAADGSIYVAGYTFGSLEGQFNSGGRNAFVTKFNSDGSKAWTRLIGVDANFVFNPDTYGFSVAEAVDGGLVVTGYNRSDLDGQSALGGQDIFVIKYKSDGSKEWTKLFGTSGGDQAYAVATSSDGSIYLGGFSSSLNGEKTYGGADGFILKLSEPTNQPIALISTKGTSAKDVIVNLSGNQSVDGLDGIDIMVFPELRSTYSITNSIGKLTVKNSVTAETDLLINVERLKFSDTSIAFDIEGNAGIVAKVIGAVFGKVAVSNPVFVGIGLEYLDNKGYGYEQLLKLALEFRLGSNPSNKQVVDLLYSNVVGVFPSQSEEMFYVGLLDSKAYTSSSLALLASETSINVANINLVGLAANGIEFI
jgi:uncharacterized protein (UPF0548 family)